MKENIVKELRKGFLVEADKFDVLMAEYELYPDILINSFALLELRQKFNHLQSAIKEYEADKYKDPYKNCYLNAALSYGKEIHKKLNKLEEQLNG